MTESVTPIPPIPPIPFLCAPGYTAADAWVAALQAAMPAERILPFDALSADERASVDVAIVANPLPSDILRLPRLRWVHSVWAGVERLVHDLGDSRLDIVRLIDPQLADTMAEAVLAWTLYLHRDMPAYADQQRRREWHVRPYLSAARRTVGILGLGALGTASAQRLVQMGFRVCGWSRRPKQVAGVECFSGDAELLDMLQQADIIVCLLPLTRETTGLLNANRIGAMPVGAQLINFARGPIIDDEALREALDHGHIRHAVLDVFALEPLPPDQWQWAHPSVTVLPHCSAPTDRQTASAIVAQNVSSFRENGVVPLNVEIARGY